MGLQSWLTEKSQNHCRKALAQNIPRFVLACQEVDRCTPGSVDSGWRQQQAQRAYEDVRVKLVGTLLPVEEALCILAAGLEHPDVIGPTAWAGLKQIFDAVRAERDAGRQP